MPWITAKEDVVVYKRFLSGGRSPVQCFNWGSLRRGKVLCPKFGFDMTSNICCSGVHAFTSRVFALNGLHQQLWEAIISKGTTYYKATKSQCLAGWGDHVWGTIVRSPVIKLVRKIGEK